MSFNLDSAIRKVPNFPKEGILFYDVTGILVDPAAFRHCVDTMVARCAGRGIDAIAAIEARGFIFAAPLAERLGLPLILVRKKGKLPGKTISRSYELEYGRAEIEIHEADIPRGKKVLLVDDLVATGGTLLAAADILRQGGATVAGVLAVVGLPFLDYAAKLAGIPVETLIDYHGE